jgi:hypothetical protein
MEAMAREWSLRKEEVMIVQNITKVRIHCPFFTVHHEQLVREHVNTTHDLLSWRSFSTMAVVSFELPSAFAFRSWNFDELLDGLAGMRMTSW